MPISLKLTCRTRAFALKHQNAAEDIRIEGAVHTQWNRLENPEINSHDYDYSQLIFFTTQKQFNKERVVVLAETIGYS